MVAWENVCGKAIIPAERVWLRDTARAVQARFGPGCVIVNIGIFRGATMYCLRAGADQARLVGIDIKYPQGHRLSPDLRAQVIVGDSGEVHARFRGAVHLLFVDGDHRYEAVKQDIRGWVRKVAPGGIVVFHDYAPEAKVAAKHAGIKRAVDEWAADAGWELLEADGSLRAYRRPEA